MERGALSWMLLSASSCKWNRQRVKPTLSEKHTTTEQELAQTKPAHCVWMNPRLA